MFTVITKGNEVRQYTDIDSIERSVEGPFLAIDNSNGSKVAFTEISPITWPNDATNGLQAIVDIKAGTLRFARQGSPWVQTEFVVSEYVELVASAPTIGTKHDHGKPILGAVPPHAELAVGRVLTFGAEKYARGNWDKVEDHENRYMDAALRHLNAHRRGELTDSESGESHLAHAACCILFMLDKQERS